MIVMNQKALDKVKDMQRGLQFAMTAMKKKDYREVEVIMQQMHARFGGLISETKIVSQR